MVVRMIPPTPEELEVALTFLPDDGAGTRTLLSQTIIDFAYGLVVSPTLLSERLIIETTVLFPNNEESTGTQWEMGEEEAYYVDFEQENAEIIVDRRSVYDRRIAKEDYDTMGAFEQDKVLITKALRQWVKENVFQRGRIPGADTKIVDDFLEAQLKLDMLRLANRSVFLQSCIEIPDATRGDSMYIELHAVLTTTDDPPSSSGSIRMWEHEELRFQMRCITYSNTRHLGVGLHYV